MVNSDVLIEPTGRATASARPSQTGPVVERVARNSPAAASNIQWFARSRAWVSLLLLVPAFVLTVGSPRHLAASGIGDIACQAFGWALFVAGGVFRWWSTLYIGGRKTSELVTTGTYSLCRNPIYLGTFLMQMSVVFFLESLTLGIATALVSAYYLGVTVTAEERRLGQIYGQKFAEYVARVPRFLPSWKTYQSTPSIVVELGGLRSEFIRMLRWMWIPGACQLVNAARDYQWFAPFTNWP